jgi:hypothetical protein
MISSAHRIESAMAQTVAGTRFPGSYCVNRRAARIEAAISRTRLRPSSIKSSYVFAFYSPTMDLGCHRSWDQSAEIFRLSSELCAKHTSDSNNNEKIVEFYRRMSGWVAKRSTPNCLWIVVLLQTIFDTLQHGIVRFAEPEFSREFENIEFVIDKSFIQRDEHLQFWKEWLRADLMKSSRESIMTIKEWPPDHPYKKKCMMHKGLYDYRDLFHDHTVFRDSKSVIGLQIADICANICYRFYRDDRKDIRAYTLLWRRIMCKGGAEIHVITVDERSLHKGDLSELLRIT